MPYTVFACPHCQTELGSDPFQSKCNKCDQVIGQNLAEKVCYYPDEICQACGKPGDLIQVSFTYVRVVPLDFFSGKGEEQYFFSQKCSSCGAERERIVSKTFIPGPAKSISRPY